jgi:hypothetical protein
MNEGTSSITILSIPINAMSPRIDYCISAKMNLFKFSQFYFL